MGIQGNPLVKIGCIGAAAYLGKIFISDALKSMHGNAEDLHHQNKLISDQYRLNVLKGNTVYSGNPTLDAWEHKLRNFLLFEKMEEVKGHVINFVNHVIIKNIPVLGLMALAIGGAFGPQLKPIFKAIGSGFSKIGGSSIWSAMGKGLTELGKGVAKLLGVAGGGLLTLIEKGGWASVGVIGLGLLLGWRFINVWNEKQQEEYFKEGTLINEPVETSPFAE